MTRRTISGGMIAGPVPDAFQLAQAGVILNPNTAGAGGANNPGIGTLNLVSGANEVGVVSWAVVMSNSGSAASKLVANVFLSNNLVIPIAAEQTHTSGIGLGETIILTFLDIPLVNGVTPVGLQLKVEVS